MLTKLLSRLGNFLQFATAGALLAASFLIQREIIALHGDLPWLATPIAVLLVVSRVLAAGYRHSSLAPSFSMILLLGSFRLALLIAGWSCSLSFFYVHLAPGDLNPLGMVIHLYGLPLTRTELLLSLAVFLALLLELALAVLVGHLARAYAPLLRAEQDYRLLRSQHLAQVENELRLTRATGRDLRDQVIAERDRIERRLRQAVATASAGKLAGSVVGRDS